MLSMLVYHSLLHPTEIRGKSIVDFVTNIREVTDMPVCIGSPIDDHELILKVPDGDEPFSARLSRAWGNPVKDSPISRLPVHEGAEALIARPRFLSLMIGKPTSAYPIRYMLRGKWFRDDQRPATPLKEFVLHGDSIKFTGMHPASLTMSNFTRLGSKPVRMHWLVSEMWIAMECDQMKLKDFYAMIARASCATYIETDDEISFDIDPKAFREAWKGTQQWWNYGMLMKPLGTEVLPSHPQMSDEILQRSLEIRREILDYMSDDEIKQAAEQGRRLAIYKFLVPGSDFDKKIKEYAYASLHDPNNILNQPGFPGAKSQLDSVEWEKFKWKVKILYPNIHILAPLKSDRNHFVTF